MRFKRQCKLSARTARTVSLPPLARGISSETDFLQAELNGGIFAREEKKMLEKRDASNIFFSLFGVSLEAQRKQRKVRRSSGLRCSDNYLISLHFPMQICEKVKRREIEMRVIMRNDYFQI